jgi:hypothetical protein
MSDSRLRKAHVRRRFLDVVELMTEKSSGVNRRCFRTIAAVAVSKKPRVSRLRKSASATKLLDLVRLRSFIQISFTSRVYQLLFTPVSRFQRAITTHRKHDHAHIATSVHVECALTPVVDF